MILVTLGTQDKSFERLLIEIERLIDNKIIEEEVIVQAGYTNYSSEKMKVFDYLPKNEFEKMIKKCNYIITHGGVGTIFDGLSYDKKIIAVPRLSEFKEHNNDHQIQVVEELGKEGYIIPCIELKNLEKSIKKIKKFHPKKYNGNHEKMTETIKNFIEKEQKITPKITKYLAFSVLFLLTFGLITYLFSINYNINLIIHLSSWIISYVLILITYFIWNRIKPTYNKKTFLFSFTCFTINQITFFLLSLLFSQRFTLIGSYIITFIISYIIFMLIIGNSKLLDSEIDNK